MNEKGNSMYHIEDVKAAKLRATLSLTLACLGFILLFIILTYNFFLKPISSQIIFICYSISLIIGIIALFFGILSLRKVKANSLGIVGSFFSGGLILTSISGMIIYLLKII